MIHGRGFCGRICPLGIMQDWVNKIPFPIKIRMFKADKYLRYLKYFVALVYFLSLVAVPNMRDTASIPALAVVTIITITILVFIVLQRPVCKYLCPAGAILSIGNKLTRHKYKVDAEKCTKCGACVKPCKMDIVPYDKPNSLECVHCGMCVQVCPRKAITE